MHVAMRSNFQILCAILVLPIVFVSSVQGSLQLNVTSRWFFGATSFGEAHAGGNNTTSRYRGDNMRATHAQEPSTLRDVVPTAGDKGKRDGKVGG